MRTIVVFILLTFAFPLGVSATTTWSASSTYIVDGAVTINSGVELEVTEGEHCGYTSFVRK